MHALLGPRERFNAGVVAFDAQQSEDARRAFTAAARALPAAGEAPFNRARARCNGGIVRWHVATS